MICFQEKISLINFYSHRNSPFNKNLYFYGYFFLISYSFNRRLEHIDKNSPSLLCNALSIHY